MHLSNPLRTTARAAGLVLLPILLGACGDGAPPAAPSPASAAADGATGAAPRASNEDPRPTLTPDLLDAYVRGMEEEIALMRADGSHTISLSMYDERGVQVAEKAGLPLPEYRGLRGKVNDVLYAHMMHGRYAGPDGQARLARLEPHKREHAVEMLAREPFDALSSAERDAMQLRLDSLRALYDRYMEIAAIGD